MNQYTETPNENRAYDLNGNLVTLTTQGEGLTTLTYDYRNQMVGYRSSDVVATYRYDPFGRRVERGISRGGAEARGVRYYYSGERVCEERDSEDQVTATYVYGRYLDEVVQVENGTGTHYFHTDDLFNVVAATDTSGDIVETYQYDDFGTPEISDAGGNLLSDSAINNPYLWNGRRFDPETGFYYYRSRYLEPGTGRFTTRDTKGIWYDGVNLGNGYTYVGNNPWTWKDPHGELALSLTAAITAIAVAAEEVLVYASAAILGAVVGDAILDLMQDQDEAPKEKEEEKNEEEEGPTTGGGAKVENLSPTDRERIQRVANEIDEEITVVGSQAEGTATEESDFDYIVGGKSNDRKTARKKLPKGGGGGEIGSSGETGIDIFNGNNTSVNRDKPHIIFHPQ